MKNAIRATAQKVAIHAPLAGGDLTCAGKTSVRDCCDPRPPRGRRPAAAQMQAGIHRCDPRPPRGRRPQRSRKDPDGFGVAIHAPLAGGDPGLGTGLFARTPLRSTPPSREATLVSAQVCLPAHRCDPRPPRGRRPASCHEDTPRPHVAIHAPLAGGDRGMRGCHASLTALRSTPPSREATNEPVLFMQARHRVAIHAPLAGGDQAKRSPNPVSFVLRSTPPSREAT